jgi:proteasome lid subunit RPN8/RPN11
MRIAQDVIHLVVAHAREAAPFECCGLLIGHGDDIVSAVRTRNIAEQPERRFLIDPADHICGRREARVRGLDVVGFYHSHPRSPAEPSPTDRADAAYPDHLHAIVSLAGDAPEVRIFRLEAGNFHERSFVTVR